MLLQENYSCCCCCCCCLCSPPFSRPSSQLPLKVTVPRRAAAAAVANFQQWLLLRLSWLLLWRLLWLPPRWRVLWMLWCPLWCPLCLLLWLLLWKLSCHVVCSLCRSPLACSHFLVCQPRSLIPFLILRLHFEGLHNLDQTKWKQLKMLPREQEAASLLYAFDVMCV